MLIIVLLLSSSLLSKLVGTMPIILGGSPELKDRFLKKIVNEHSLVAFCFTEPNAGSDASAIHTKALFQKNQYLINERKCFISNGGVSDLYTVFTTSDPTKRFEGISAFIIERKSLGLSIGKTENKMGIRGSNTTEMIFEDVRVPRDERIGGEGEGWWLVMRTLNRSRLGIGAQAGGVAQGALDHAIQFGQKKNWFQR